MGGTRRLLFALPVLTIGLVHTAIVSGHATYTVAVIALMPVTHLILAWIDGAGWRRRAALAGVIAALALLQAVILNGGDHWVNLIKVPPVLIHGWLTWMFGRTLLPGQEPLIHRFSRFNRGVVPPELEAYTRRLTVAWTVLFAAMTLGSAALAVMAPSVTWSWIVNLGMPGLAALIFLGDHGYRALVYRHLGHNSPVGTLRTLLKTETWTAP